MAVTDYDHITALRNRLLNTKHQKEAEIREIDEMIRVLGDAPRLLTGKPFDVETVKQEANKKQAPTRTLQNRNVTQLVREYIEGFQNETPINVQEVIKYLRDKGVVGKERSLYSSIHVILKKEQAKGVVAHMKGLGFFKPQKSEVKEGNVV